MQYRLRLSAILHRSRQSYINVSSRTSGLFGLRAVLTERLRGSVTRICSQRRTEPSGPPRSPPGAARPTRHVAAERREVNMLNLSQEFLCGLALLASAATASASAAPVDGDLLR